MPRNKIEDDDLDFQIFVDPSCLSEPAEDTEPSADTNTGIAAQPSMATEQLLDAVLPDSESVEETASITVEDIDVPQDTQAEDVKADKEEETTPATQAEEGLVIEEQQEDAPAEPTEEILQDTIEPKEANPSPSVDDQNQPTAEPEPEHKEEEQAEAATELDNDTQEEPSATEDVSIVESEASPEQLDALDEAPETKDLVAEVTQESHIEDQDVPPQEEEPQPEHEADQATQQDESVEEAAATESHEQDDAAEDVVRSVSSQGFTDRKTSLRTEALIQAAARAVVAKLERRQTSGDSIQPEEDDLPEQIEHSIISTATEEGDDTLLQYDDHKETTSRRQSTNSTGSQLHHDVPASGDEGGEESSSHHDQESSDDVFSDRSARSSIASFDNNPPPPTDEERELIIKSPSLQQQHNLDQSDRQSVRSSNHTRSPRVSGVSMISDLSQYDKEESFFIPTSREARLPFRTPSAIRNIQMSSPTPSVIHGVSPRSSKRQNNIHNSGGMMPTISRLGSPTVPTTQFSPKGRSTPTRLKPRREAAPLVLLHVTVLPLSWMWGDILNCLDALNGKTYGENKEVFEASEQLKSLRDSWRELQDHVSDTVLERGVLMPHPQDDFEVLEERFLESLELPLRRRARILECGHYLGPANEFGPEEEEFLESEDEGETDREEKRHWCNMCRNEIKYEDLGPGKVFRVKVYASNGLMRAGAWEACWREMERVDVEVEPIVDMSVQNELEKLVIINAELEEQRQRELEEHAEAEAAAAVAAQAVRDEEAAQLPVVVPQSRPQSVAANANMFDEGQVLPSLIDTPTQDHQQARSSAIISSPSPSSMQMMSMHGSSAQPPSTMAPLRFASPSSPQPTQSSPLRHAILPPDDHAPQQDVYAETIPQPPLPIEPAGHIDSTSSIYTHHPQTAPSNNTSISLSRGIDSYVPPASPRSPSEAEYERRHRRASSSRGRSTHSHQSHSQKYDHPTAPENLENASFIELMLEAFKVLLRDPKNVAIIVLCLFMMAILGRPSSSLTAPGQTALQLVQQPGDGKGYGYEPKVPVAEVVGGQVVAPVVQVESVHTTETSASVLVVTTTVTSAPAEASVEVAVPVVEPEIAVEPEPTLEAATMAEKKADGIIASDSVLEGVEEPVVEGAENVAEPLDALSAAASSNSTASPFTEEGDQANIAGTNQTEASMPLPVELDEELATFNTTDVPELSEPAEVEAAASTIAPVDEESEPILEQEDVLIGPQNLEPSTASSSVAPFQEVTETATAAAEEIDAAATSSSSSTEAKDPCPSIISQRTTLRIVETVTETVTVSATSSANNAKVTSEVVSVSESSPAESQSTPEAKSATTTTTTTTTTALTEEISTASTSSVSAVTEAPPAPKTVQETVYETETETVRVTVSVGGSGHGHGRKQGRDEL